MPEVAGHHIHSVTLGSGAPCVMVHCMLARHEAMLPLAKNIEGNITLLDMPGHGRSDAWDGAHDYQSLVTKAIAASCHGPTHIVGHSFGGTAALRLAVEHPELVSRLTLIEPVYFAAAKGTPEMAAHAKVFRPFVAAMLMGEEARAAELFNQLWSHSAWSEMPPRRQAYMTDRVYLVVAGGAAIEEDADGITSPERLAGLKMPVALIRGAQTEPVIAAVHEALVQRIPHAQDHVIADAGHMISMTHVKEIAAIMRAADQETG